MLRIMIIAREKEARESGRRILFSEIKKSIDWSKFIPQGIKEMFVKTLVCVKLILIIKY